MSVFDELRSPIVLTNLTRIGMPSTASGSLAPATGKIQGWLRFRERRTEWPELRPGYANNEIAHRLGCVCRTVERKLDVIRKAWRQADQGMRRERE